MPQAEQPELSYRCEHCIGGQGFKSQARLEEHLANVHALGLDEALDEARSPDDEQSAKDAARHAQRVLDALTRDDERSATTEPGAA